jgi:4-amino-4-deoxy-L-arabinose transferase-like glycosyltransferase
LDAEGIAGNGSGALRAGLAVLVLGAAITLPRIGAHGLWDPWEPRYVGVAEEMAASGDWIVPRLDGDPRLNRPPATYWMIGLSQAVFGTSEWASRLPGALLAITAAAALAASLALRGLTLAGFIAGAALVTSPQWLLLARFATLASPLAAFGCLLLALALAAPAVTGVPAKRAASAAAVALLAAGALTDFPRGLLLPVWAVLGWGLVSRGWLGPVTFCAVAIPYHAGQLLHSAPLILLSYGLSIAGAGALLVRRAGIPLRSLAAGTAAVALFVAPWFVAVGAMTDGELKLFNYKYALNLGEGPGQHTGPYRYVLAIVAAGSLAWSAAALAGLARAFGAERDEPARVLAGALVGTLAFFVLAEARMGHFYVAVQPALAGLAGVGLVALVRRRDWSLALVVAAVAGVLAWVHSDPSLVLESATVKSSLFGADVARPVTLALAAWAGVVVVAWLARRPLWTAGAVLPAALVAVHLAWWTVPGLEAKKSFRPIWKHYLEERREGEPLGLSGVSSDGADYYVDDYRDLDDAGEVREFLAGGGRRFLVLPRKRIGALEQMGLASGGTFEPIDETHPAYSLLRFEPR